MLHNITLVLFIIAIIWIIVGSIGVFIKPSKLNDFIRTNIYFYGFIIILVLAITSSIFTVLM